MTGHFIFARMTFLVPGGIGNYCEKKGFIMVKKKLLWFVVAVCFLSASSLWGKVILLSRLEKGGNSVGIIGLGTEDWYLKSEGRWIVHAYLNKKDLKKDSAYASSLKRIIKQQLCCNEHKGVQIDFLLEGRSREGKTPLFPLKLVLFYEKMKKQQENLHFSCCNIWDKKIEELCCVIYDIVGGISNICRNHDQAYSVGGFKGIFVVVRDWYCKMVKLAGIKPVEDTIFWDCLHGMEDIIETMDYFCKKFRGDANFFKVIKNMMTKGAQKHRKKNRRCKQGCGCERCMIVDLVDDISNCFWSAKSFSRVIKSQMKKGCSKTIIMCERDLGNSLIGMLKAAGYKERYYRVKDSKQESDEKMYPPFMVKTFVNSVLTCCDCCGKQAKTRCPNCKNVWYCSVQCQKKKWKKHKKICKRMISCNFCKEGCEKAMRCSRCKGVVYCSKECQLQDWKEHKKACKKND